MTLTANWYVRCEATQFALPATNHGALSSRETRSPFMRKVIWTNFGGEEGGRTDFDGVLRSAHRRAVTNAVDFISSDAER